MQCGAIKDTSLKLDNPSNFSIPISIGNLDVDNALCNFGTSVSLMPLSPCTKGYKMWEAYSRLA